VGAPRSPTGGELLGTGPSRRTVLPVALSTTPPPAPQSPLALFASPQPWHLGAPPGLEEVLACPAPQPAQASAGARPKKRPPGLEESFLEESPEQLLLPSTPATMAPATPGSACTELSESLSLPVTPAGSCAVLEDGRLESVVLSLCEVCGVACTRAEWQIVHFCRRLKKTGLGKPLVSQPFNLPGLPELRLMVCPDPDGLLDGMNGKKKQSRFVEMVTRGPLKCALKLKVPLATAPVLSIFLTVGSGPRQGPITCDLAEKTTHGWGDCGIDWLTQVEDDGCLRVAVEVFGSGSGPPTAGEVARSGDV